MASAVSDIIGPGYSEKNSAGTGTKTVAGTRGDADGPEGSKGKIDITTLDKTNKTLILVNYWLNIRLFIKTYNVKRKMSKFTIL